MLLDAKVAIVTGAAHGIGRAIAERFAREGARVVVADIDGTTAETVATNLTAAGAQAAATEVDVTRRESIDALFAFTIERFGGLDVLVNNAGGGKPTPCLDITDEEWDAMFTFNVKSAFWCCQAALRLMTPKRSGKIINMSSAAGRSRGQVAGPHYGAAKAAVIGFTRNLAREVGPLGINVNAICPGIVATERLVRHLEATGRLASEAEVVPLRRLGTPEDIAGGALFLASDLSSYMTGAMLDMNGGLHML